jgi:Prolyl oligopeptidase family
MFDSRSSVLRRTAALLVLAAGVAAAQDQEPDTARPRQRVVMDSARMVALYVSKDPGDHPVADYARAITRKAATDSIFTARSVGVMKFSKTVYTSPVDGLQIPASVFEPLTARGARTQPALVWVHGGVHGNWDQNYLPFIKEAVRRGYVVIAPDYRGSTGYGKEFHERIDYGGKEVDDVLASVQVLRQMPNVDTTRGPIPLRRRNRAGDEPALPVVVQGPVVPALVLHPSGAARPAIRESRRVCAALPVLLGGQPAGRPAGARGDERRRRQLRGGSAAD